MYNACTIMYIHIRSQASDWNCCVKRLFVCAQQSTSLIVHIKIRRIPHKRERDREKQRDIERYRNHVQEPWERCAVGHYEHHQNPGNSLPDLSEGE